jgi:hypothetical protein
MRRKIGVFGILAAVLTICVLPGAWAAADTAPIVQNNCMKCHQKFGKMENVVAGNMKQLYEMPPEIRQDGERRCRKHEQQIYGSQLHSDENQQSIGDDKI